MVNTKMVLEMVTATMTELFGLPAHPLLVHIPIILIPLAMTTALLALVPRARVVMLAVTAFFSVIGGVGILLAASTGEQFQEQVKKNGNALVRNHAELGDAAQAPGVIFAVVAVIALLVVMLRISTHPIAQKARARISLLDWLATLTLVLTLLGGIWATNAVVQAGHSGAKSVWQEQLKK